MPRRRAILLLALAALAALLGALPAEARAETLGELFQARFQAERKKGLVFHFQRAKADWGEPGQALAPGEPPRRAVLVGDVRCETRDGARVRIYADGMVVWGKIGSVGQVLDAAEIYCEGNVLLVAFGETFEGEALYLDLAEGEGVISRATIRSSGEGTRGSPLLVRAERARVWNGLTSFDGESAVVSTCTYHEPHFAIHTDRVQVAARRDEIGSIEEGQEDSAGLSVTRPRFAIYEEELPAWPGSLDWDTHWDRFLPQVTPGNSGRFGWFALSKLPLYPGRNLEASAVVNVYEERGAGVGGGATWHGPARDDESYFGFADVFYIHDEGESDTSTRLPVPDEDRLRLKGFHRDDMPFGFRRELELSYLSDRALLGEYFEKEAKQGKEQETAAYGRWLHENMGANLEGRWRLNDFQTQTEYLPRARFFWIGEPFLESLLPSGRGVYLTSAAELSNVRQQFDEDTLRPSERVLRLDLQERLDWPFPVGPVQVDPFFLGRYSAWSTGLEQASLNVFDPRPDGRATDRWVAGGGAVATTDIWRDFDDLRHIITPSVGYTNVFHVDTKADELYPIDGVEAARREAYIPFGIRNRVQVLMPGLERPVNVFDLDVTARYFTQVGEADHDRWGDLRGDLRVQPLPFIGGRWRSDWDPNQDGGLFRSDAELWYRPQSDVRFGVAHRFFEATYRAVEGSIDSRLTEKWSLRVSSQYDFEQRGFTNNRLTVIRWFHRFVMDASIDADFGEHDVRFAVHFMPLELYGTGDPYFGTDVQRQQDPLF